MSVQPRPAGPGWTIAEAEALLTSLPGVLSARVVARPGGEVEEIHLLTDTEVLPKQTVRNVESALRARFDLSVDHRKISVAQTDQEAGEAAGAPAGAPTAPAEADPTEGPGAESGPEGSALTLHRPADEAPASEPRILFLGHQVESERAQRVRTRVRLEWRGEPYTGEAAGNDLPRARLESLATATLDAVHQAVSAHREEAELREHVDLHLDGLKVVEALDRDFVLVSVHATDARGPTSLAGAATADANLDRSVILATLQATDRWVRRRMQEDGS